MKRAIVVGSGAAGAAAARDLAGRFDVTILEAGGAFRPYTTSIDALEWLRRTPLLLRERQIHWFFPSVRIRKAGEMLLVSANALGGSTTLGTATALRRDADLQALGIDLGPEFDQIAREIRVSSDHRQRWLPTTRRLYEICEQMHLAPQTAPKLIDFKRCKLCGRCVAGCERSAKWDARDYLDEAGQRGARVVTGCRVERLVIKDGRAVGVHGRCGLIGRVFTADVIILAAGGVGSPAILERSGIPTEPRLFVQPTLTVGAEWRDAHQCSELPSPFVVERERYSISPYFDPLSFLFHRDWRKPGRHLVSLMIQLADTAQGRVTKKGLEKRLDAEDRAVLDEATGVCREILERLGATRTFLGKLSANHVGGALPATAAGLHPDRLPENVWVADATLLPNALTTPPILTEMALGKRIAKLVAQAELGVAAGAAL